MPRAIPAATGKTRLKETGANIGAHYKEEIRNTRILVEPIYRRQPQEKDDEYKLFLIYRDLPWETRSMREVTAIACNVHINTVKHPHRKIVIACHDWQWVTRVKAYDLWIQENNSEREENLRLKMKSDIEFICFRLAKKIRLIGEIAKSEDLMDPEIQRDMAIVEALVGKGNAGKFVLDAYKTIVGQKLQLSAIRNLPALEWKAE